MEKSSFLFASWRYNLLAIVIVVLLTALDKLIPPLGIPLALICVFLLFRWRKQPMRELGLFQPQSWLKTALIGLFVGAFITALGMFVLLPAIKWLGIVSETPAFDEGIEGNLSKLAIYLVVSWTTAGLGEELIYRSFFLGQFASVFGNNKHKWILSLIISSVIFGFLHFNNGVYAIIVTGINGFILGIVYLKTNRNVWAAYFAHAFANTIELLIIYFGLYNGLL